MEKIADNDRPPLNGIWFMTDSEVLNCYILQGELRPIIALLRENQSFKIRIWTNTSELDKKNA